MGVSIALLIAAFAALVAGVGLIFLPAGIITGGLLLAVAGVALIRLPDRDKGDRR